MKILTVFGTRPEAIKMCPLVKALKGRGIFDTYVCVTGQHKEMLEQVLKIFNIIPDYNLNIMKNNQTLNDITSNILIMFKNILDTLKPDLVLVHGDTTTSFATALASFYQGIPVGHVESGLRTYNIKSPYPEEFNRQAVGLIAKYNFCPTQNAYNNLLNEGKTAESLFITGNTVIDSLKTTVNTNYSGIYTEWAKGSKLILMTAHRRENIGSPMLNMFNAINDVVLKNNDLKLLYPIHKNPKVREIANIVFSKNDRIKIVEPLDVYDFHNILARSYLILTDSGGIQEEATSLGKPVLVLRNTTERPEGINSGTLKLIGTSYDSVYHHFSELLEDDDLYREMSMANNPYGDGYASEKICSILEKELLKYT